MIAFNFDEAFVHLTIDKIPERAQLIETLTSAGLGDLWVPSRMFFTSVLFVPPVLARVIEATTSFVDICQALRRLRDDIRGVPQVGVVLEADDLLLLRYVAVYLWISMHEPGMLTMEVHFKLALDVPTNLGD